MSQYHLTVYTKKDGFIGHANITFEDFGYLSSFYFNPIIKLQGLYAMSKNNRRWKGLCYDVYPDDHNFHVIKYKGKLNKERTVLTAKCTVYIYENKGEVLRGKKYIKKTKNILIRGLLVTGI